MDWTFIYLMLILKLPILGLLYLVWWSVRQEPEDAPAADDDGGIKTHPQGHPRHPRPPLPRSPRRGPHGTPALPAPARIRSVVARGRSTSRPQRQHQR
jgi:hypothetical protein